MAWETRQRGGLYYCRSFRRPDGSVGRQYIGAGPQGERAAQQDQESCRQRRRQFQVTKELEAKLLTVNRVIRQMSERTVLMLAASLLAAGFHQHRGEWRKLRYDRTQ